MADGNAMIADVLIAVHGTAVMADVAIVIVADGMKKNEPSVGGHNFAFSLRWL